MKALKNMAIAGVIGLTAIGFVYHLNNKGVDVSAMDTKAKPQDDFFNYANGGWINNNPIPASEGRWTAFNIVNERNNELLRKILEDAAKLKPGASAINQKIGLFYKTAMDTALLNQTKFAPLHGLLQNIEAINSRNDLIKTIAELHLHGISAAFGFEISQDVKNSSFYTPYLAQSGLGLPDRDYYLKGDTRSQKIKEEYIKYVNNLFGLFEADKQGNQDAKKETNSPAWGDMIVEFETQLAQRNMSRTERRDMDKQYNPYSISRLNTELGALLWNEYFDALGIKIRDDHKVIVMQIEYFSFLNQFINDDLKNWKTYLKWKVLNSTAPYLHEEADKLHFDFYGKLLTGTKEQKPRWKRVIGFANNMIGEWVAQEFVKVAFTPESKQRVNVMVDNLREAFRSRIQGLDWMSPATKVKAIEKLNSFTRKLGYPDKWTDMSKLELTSNSLVEIYFNSNKFWTRHNLDKLDKKVDKSEWEMLPQTVNAYYNPVNNEIVFPAAIMQPPFFDPAADDAVNYGAIGAVIGHEFSHGFDDQGSKYDAQGNLNSWWTEEDRKKFEARTAVLVKQFNGYEVLDSVFINGELTLGENIADLAGLTVAFDAYQRSLVGKPRTNIDGFTPEQRFFIGFAQVWRGHARPEFLRQQVLTDPHSPARYRVIGTLSNMPEFYKAFSVKKGNLMFKTETERAFIW
ncbi:MAG: M13 family metallopeptidase [Bacteroidia bacterium]|jgi:putative endopeptidase|nr:M13 family metallopeptidase [Bacteroidia bacterium]